MQNDLTEFAKLYKQEYDEFLANSILHYYLIILSNSDTIAEF